MLHQPRKRPVQARSLMTFNSIVEATARILETHGFLGLNTNAVAILAGVSIGSLYQYFPCKKTLVVELLQREREILLNQMIQINQNLDLKQQLKKMIHVAIQHQFSRPQLARTLEFASLCIGQDDAENEFQF